eukprot:3076764-Amphidinium_carterae.1
MRNARDDTQRVQTATLCWDCSSDPLRRPDSIALTGGMIQSTDSCPVLESLARHALSHARTTMVAVALRIAVFKIDYFGSSGVTSCLAEHAPRSGLRIDYGLHGLIIAVMPRSAGCIVRRASSGVVRG